MNKKMVARELVVIAGLLTAKQKTAALDDSGAKDLAHGTLNVFWTTANPKVLALGNRNLKMVSKTSKGMQVVYRFNTKGTIPDEVGTGDFDQDITITVDVGE